MKIISFIAFILLINPGGEEKINENATVDLYGTVIEDMTGEPIPGASVYFQEIDQTIYTDFDGNFALEDLKPGEYNIEVSFISFEKMEIRKYSILKDSTSLMVRLH